MDLAINNDNEDATDDNDNKVEIDKAKNNDSIDTRKDEIKDFWVREELGQDFIDLCHN